jgi:hypothetical protein
MTDLTLHASIAPMLSDVIFINFHSSVTLAYSISSNNVVITDWMPKFVHFLWKRLFHGELTSVTENLHNALIAFYVTIRMEISQRQYFPEVWLARPPGLIFCTIHFWVKNKIKVKFAHIKPIKIGIFLEKAFGKYCLYDSAILSLLLVTVCDVTP